MLCFSPFAGRTYIHVSDRKPCFHPDGSFDYRKAKSVTLSYDEIKEMNVFLEYLDHYDQLFQRQQVCHFFFSFVT